ncbi:MAG: UDP-N-acetylmuramoyl-L-alanine--D-glutamate ligase [Ilumatobacteraceae bacterium]
MSGERTLVYGIGITGEAIARAVAAHGHEVVLADDSANPRAQALAGELGVDLVEAPDDHAIASLVRSASAVLPAPGVPETHAVVVQAQSRGVPVRTELDVAYEWEQQRPGGPRPMIGITGTDGKTTTTTMVASLLQAGGLRAAAVGNTEVPLVAALDGPFDAFAVECSSFRLAFAESFRAEAAIWLNLAPDHQNWHRSMASYESAKARIFDLQRPTDVAVGWVGDPLVTAHLAAAPGRRVTFGLEAADYRAVRHDDGSVSLCGPGGEIAAASSLPRTFPHDITNALAAIAACVEPGLVAPDRVDEGLAAFRVPPHRIEPVGTVHGVEWFNDSKATSPHAALTAIRSFDSIVLIAGGRNKGLDLSSLATEAARIRAVVAIGEAADEVERAFDHVRPVERATSMADAVAAAERLARPGDVVLLSPACASFDWYPSGGYPARGDDFRALVDQLRMAREVGGAA